jgi:disulfide bond formation protein DsbB
MTLNRRDFQVVAGTALCAGGALGLALIAQYGFNLWPCTICYWQRVPYIFALALSALALMPAVDAPSRRLVIMLCAGLFTLNVGIAFYHVGVETRWWPGPAECAGQVREFSVEDMMSALNQPGRGGCEDPAFVFLGLSMAGYNAVASLVLAGLAALAVKQRIWWT